MLKRYKMYYNEAVGKIEMYLLCQKYHMSGCVQYEQNSKMMVELYGEGRKTITNIECGIQSICNESI